MGYLKIYFGILLIAFFINASAALGEQKSSAKISYFDLPVQALQISLVEFGVQAKVSIIADHHLLKGQRSSPVIGPLPVERALRNLLAKTDLVYRFDVETKTYIIEKPAPVTKPEHPKHSVEIPPEPPGIEELLVKSVYLPFRYQTITNSHMLGDLPYFDSSRFINTLPAILIEDLHPKEVGELLKYASGITPGEGLGDSNDDFYIRGFRRHAVYIDGFRSSDLTGLKLIPANIEHIEILKGPSTLLFGQAEPGGIVNVVRKRPRDDQFVMAEAGAGNFGRQYLTIDANTPVLDETLDMRMVIFNETQDESAEITNINRRLVAPSAVWNLSPETQLWATYEYQWESKELYKDFVTIDFINEVGERVLLGDGVKSARPEFSAESNFVSLGLTHYFTDTWKFNAQYFWRDEDRFGSRVAVDTTLSSGLLYDNPFNSNTMLNFFTNKLVIPLFFLTSEPEFSVRIGPIRSIYDEKGFETNNNIKLKLEGTFDSRRWTHHLMLGVEWYQQDIVKDYVIESRNLFPDISWSFDEYVRNSMDILLTVSDPNQPLGLLEQKQVGLLYDESALFVQDVIELSDRWVLTLGGRYSYLEGEHIDLTEGAITPMTTYERFSGQLGLVYKMTESHSLYANYSEAMRANYHIDEFGANRAPPELSDQIEVGIKSMLLDGRIQATLGLFKIDKNDVHPFASLMASNFEESLVQANQLVQGMDMDFTMQVSPELNILAGASLIDAKLVSGVDRGNRPLMTARKTFSLFGNYELSDNLDFSTGLKYVSNRYRDNANLSEIKPYTTVDMSIGWKKQLFNQEVKLQLGVINLLDKEYSLAGFYSSPPNLAEGRSLTVSVRMDW